MLLILLTRSIFPFQRSDPLENISEEIRLPAGSPLVNRRSPSTFIAPDLCYSLIFYLTTYAHANPSFCTYARKADISKFRGRHTQAFYHLNTTTRRISSPYCTAFHFLCLLRKLRRKLRTNVPVFRQIRCVNQSSE